MNTALSIDIGGKLPLIVPIRDVLELVAELRGEGRLERRDVPRAFDRERFVNRISSRHLLQTATSLNLPALLVERKLGSAFNGRAGATRAIRSGLINPQRRHPDGEGLVIIAYARNSDGCPPLETGHLFALGDHRFDAAIDRYEAEGLAVDFDIIKMLRADLMTCPPICVVSSWVEFARPEAAAAAQSTAGARK